MAPSLRHRPVALIVMDGWGIRPDSRDNAVSLARTPVYKSLLESHPHTRLTACGESVGLPAGQMGNSEVGHLNLGAGRIVYQELTRIGRSIDSGEFFERPAFLDLVRGVKERSGRLHLMGLLSDGGVHSHQRHAWALLELAKREGVEDVCVHAFMDGRDCAPESGAGFLRQLQARMDELGTGRVASVSGRYFAMDRDKRWERVQRAYDAAVTGTAPGAGDAVAAVEASYARGVTDEFFEPVTITSDRGPVGPMRAGDGVICFNFRADRAREISLALMDPGFDGFPRPRLELHYATMTQYREDFAFPAAFASERMKHILGEMFAHHGLKNLRMAETEKYAHVTYFFNGGEETPFEGEERILIPSPKVATYDLQPEMSARPLTACLLEQIESRKHDAIVVNYANADMVGHTGVLEAAVKAVETVDECVGQIVRAILAQGGAAMITADHGNCELMWDDATQGPHTAHTTNPVPFIVASSSERAPLRDGGILADVAPTFLGLLGFPAPAEMTGRDLCLRP